MKLGADYDRSNENTNFLLWAPQAKKVWLDIDQQKREMNFIGSGYFQAEYPCKPGTRYHFWLDQNKKVVDPVSRFQPEGVFGPSEVVDTEFKWTDHNWSAPAFKEWVIYELHVGTFTQAGTFEAIIEDLPRLKKLGITTLELMPVSQFSGARNWGYDGVFPFAAQNSYGGPLGLKKLVNACHEAGLAIILDVVYNHLGPEGAILHHFGEYFQTKYHTPWGSALNFDGGHSNQVRRFFIENAKQWLVEFHFDGLRLDAVQTILDTSAISFLEELGIEKTKWEQETGRALQLIAETDSNDARIITSREKNGIGLDAHWNDDFHHCIHTLLTKETKGYYADYGKLSHLAKVYQKGVYADGIYSSYLKHQRGRSYQHIERYRLVTCLQNHDQIGNRKNGDRLSNLVSWDQLIVAAGCAFLSPFLPLIFMGEEFGEQAPFLYFIDHQDPELVKAVQQGRAKEFASFEWGQEAPPDPVAKNTFNKCKINRTLLKKSRNQRLAELYQVLIAYSKWIRKHQVFEANHISVHCDETAQVLILRSPHPEPFCVLFNFNTTEQKITLPAQMPNLACVFDSQYFMQNEPTPAKVFDSSLILSQPKFLIFGKQVNL